MDPARSEVGTLQLVRHAKGCVCSLNTPKYQTQDLHSKSRTKDSDCRMSDMRILEKELVSESQQHAYRQGLPGITGKLHAFGEKILYIILAAVVNSPHHPRPPPPPPPCPPSFSGFCFCFFLLLVHPLLLFLPSSCCSYVAPDSWQTLRREGLGSGMARTGRRKAT